MKANINDIDALLAKYYNATATIEEEQALRALLSEESLPERYLSDKAVVLASIGELVSVPTDLSSSIMSAIESEVDEAKLKQRRRRSRIVVWLSSAAAVALLLLFGIKQINHGEESTDKAVMATNTKSDRNIISPQNAVQSPEVNIASEEKAFKPLGRKKTAVSHSEILVSSETGGDDSDEIIELDFAEPLATAEELIAYEKAEQAMVKMSIILDRTMVSIGYAPE